MKRTTRITLITELIFVFLIIGFFTCTNYIHKKKSENTTEEPIENLDEWILFK